jgi:eukaryotic-like serine/threonine-protein kinase
MAAGPAELSALSRLLDDALALQPEQRNDWLKSLSGEDAVHRETLARLLDDADQPDDDPLLTRPQLGRFRSPGPRLQAEQPGMRVGPYALVRQIGSGGMGSVWLAQRVDGVMERSVALKLPHLSWGPALNARLARERDILARLAHPNIARLYDAGSDAQGRPYLALEYVEGLPIDVYLKHRPLQLRECLLLFKQVATAVAFAHRHLIVHRDLKPSNVLVGEDGTAHLLDFGIAKLLSGDAEGATQLTQAAGRMLTPGYASPEQIRGDPVTVASDVYSLGVLLYEMLTGTRPFDAANSSTKEMEASLTEQLAPLASSRAATKTFQRTLRGDIDTILAKALRKEPEARYGTVDALIDDVDRYLNGEPVMARPASGWYRASRFVKRHRDYVALGTLAMLALLLGFGTAVVQAQRAQAQAARAEAVRDFVLGLFDLNHGDDPNKIELGQYPAQELVERGVRRLQSRYQQQPALRAEMMGIAGTIFADIGDPRHAAEMAEGQLAALKSSPGDWRERIAALRVLARAQIQQLHNDLAEETLSQAIREAGSQRGQEVAVLHSMLAHVQYARSKFSAASEQLDEAESLLQTDTDRRSLVYAEILRNRGLLLLWDRKDPAAARALFARARQLTEGLTGPLSAESIALKKSFALSLLQFGDVGAARSLYDELLSQMRRVSGDDDLEAASLEFDLLWRLNDLRLLPDDGIGRYQQLMATFDRNGSAVPPLLRARADLFAGAAYTERGDIQLAEPLMKHAYQAFSASSPEPDSEPVFGMKYVALYFYGRWADEAGQHDVATALWDEIYRVRRTALAAAGVRRDSVIDPEIEAVRSRLMGADLASAAERLAGVKKQLASGRPKIASIHWDPRWEALALEALLDIENGKYPEAGELIGEWTRRTPQERAQDLLIYTLWPAGFDAMQAIVDCNTAKSRAGLDLLNALIAANQERLSARSPTLAYLRAQAGLCALQSGQTARARESQAAARRAFTDQPAVSKFYKRPLIELEHRLSRRLETRHCRHARPGYSESKPSSTCSAARSTARALASVSFHSDSGTESATIPAAACTYSTLPLMMPVRIAIARSMSPAKLR